MNTFARATRSGSIACIVLASTLACAALLGCSGTQARDEARAEQSEYHFQLAYGYYLSNESPMAIRELREALVHDDRNTSALLLLGVIFQGRRDFVNAEHYYRTALDISPNLHEARNNLGTVLLHTERWDEAVELFSALTRVDIYNTPQHAHNNLGWALYNLGRYQEALDQFELAIMFEPDYCLAYNNKGMALERLGHTRDAQRAYDGAVRRCATYAEPHYRLAVLLVQSSDEVERAFELFQRCYDMQPESLYGQRCFEYLSLSRAR